MYSYICGVSTGQTEVGVPEMMRRFELHRLQDISGVSGTGTVAEGVEFSDGRVAIRWRTETASTVLYDCIADAVIVHGHNEATQFRYLDTGDV